MSFFESSESSGFNDLLDSNIEVVQTSSYDEEALKDKIDSTGLKRELFGCALQLSIIGWGRGNYGEIMIEGTKKSLANIFDEAGVFYGNDSGTDLDPDDLTPRRIVRIFRYQIQGWIERKNLRSFLLRKYGHNKGEEFNKYIFPGAEHLITQRHHANALIECYSELDRTQGSHFVDRVKTIFKTREVHFD
jgi:hypothetical protein